MVVNKNKAITFLLLFLTLISAFMAMSDLPGIAYAEKEYSFDSTNVIDDLNQSTVNGKPFDIKQYPFSDTGQIQLFNFVEYCYTPIANMRGNYALYLYVYNPKNIKIAEKSQQNKIQMAVSYDKDGKANRYEKFVLKYCGQTDGNYKGLFYKFKVIDRAIDGKLFAHRVNSNERRYDISGIELIATGDKNATEYNVGGTYKFTGYAQGYGPDKNEQSTLNCVVENFETAVLSVHHTYYRTNPSSLGRSYYNQVNSVYFELPKRFIDTYGGLQKIRAEWWEYQTKMAVITSNMDFYNKAMNYVGIRVGNDGSNSDIPFRLGTNYNHKQINTGTTFQPGNVIDTTSFDWSFNEKQFQVIQMGNSISQLSKEVSDMLPYVFYSPSVGVDGVFNFLYSKPNAGEVSDNQLANWIYNEYENKTKSTNEEYIDCNGRNIRKDLFKGDISKARKDKGFKMGYNDVTIDLEDTFDLHSYDSNHSWWDKLLDYGFSFPKTDGDVYDVKPIQILESKDLVGSDEDVSKRLLINQADVLSIREMFARANISDPAEIVDEEKVVVVFRFAQTDYYSENARRMGPDDNSESDTYVASTTCFFDFDIIELTFNKNGVYTVIPAVSSPIDAISGFTPPATGLDWWKILLGVLLVLVLIILLWPFIPYILHGIVWVLVLPAKGIKAAVDKHKETKEAKEEEQNNEDI